MVASEVSEILIKRKKIFYTHGIEKLQYHVPSLHCNVVCRYPSVPLESGAGGGGWADPDPGAVGGEEARAEQEAETAHHLDRWDIQWVIG